MRERGADMEWQAWYTIIILLMHDTPQNMIISIIKTTSSLISMTTISITRSATWNQKAPQTPPMAQLAFSTTLVQLLM